VEIELPVTSKSQLVDTIFTSDYEIWAQR
ncbi:MAG: hypothetical protein ACI9FD_000350, partial [Gammaproteobacteria bacterium]